MSDAYITDITTENFSEILGHSSTLPVLMHFWEPLNETSQQANALLEKLANEFAGQFILAKIHAGQHPDLASRSGVSEVPYYKLVFKGEIIAEQAGGQSESDYRALLEPHLVKDPSEQLREQAQLAFANGQFDEAVQLIAEAAKTNPNNFKVHLDLVQMYLLTGHLDKATNLFDKLPEEAHQSSEGKRLRGILSFSKIADTSADIESIQQTLQQDPNDPDALYGLAAYLALHNHPEKAMQTLLKLFQINRTYQEGVPQKALISLFNMLSESHPQLVSAGRRQMQSLLY